MDRLNTEFEGRLTLAIRIFKGTYKKKFLHQLVSGQLDMDRMDYLNQDSFYSGVSEGVISFDRIIKMLNVKDDQLRSEEHTSELQSLMRISYAVLCLKKQTKTDNIILH